MEKNMVLTFYNFTQKHKHFRALAIFIAKSSSFIFTFIYLITASFLYYNQLAGFVLYVAVPALTFVISLTLRKLIKRPRPYLAYQLSSKYAIKKSWSFPSNHSVCATIIAFSCIFVDFYFGMGIFFLAVLTGISRIFLGLHYPTDVIAGFVLGGVAAAIGYQLIPSLF